MKHAVSDEHRIRSGWMSVESIDGGRNVRAHLNTLGIHVGDAMRVVERAPFHGPVLVEIHGTRVALGRGVARKVMVRVNATVAPLAD